MDVECTERYAIPTWDAVVTSFGVLLAMYGGYGPESFGIGGVALASTFGTSAWVGVRRVRACKEAKRATGRTR